MSEQGEQEFEAVQAWVARLREFATQLSTLLGKTERGEWLDLYGCEFIVIGDDGRVYGGDTDWELGFTKTEIPAEIVTMTDTAAVEAWAKAYVEARRQRTAQERAVAIVQQEAKEKAEYERLKAKWGNEE